MTVCRPALLALLTLAVPAASAQTEAEITHWTTGVGRMLAGYYAALGVAEGEVGDRGGVVPDLYAGGPYDDGWAFSFGALEGDSVFVIDYGVIVAGDGSVTSFEAFTARREASPYHTMAARALAAVRADAAAFRQSRSEFAADAYRAAVLPFPRGRVTAFVSPAQTRPGVTLMGNDLMYTLDRAELQPDEPTRFHHRLMPMPLEAPTGGFAALLVPDAPLPSPIDVLNAIERRSPLVMAAGRGVYLVGADGSIERLADDDPRAEAARRAVE